MQVELTSVNPSLSVAPKSKGVDYTVVAGTRCAITVKLFDHFGNARPRGKDLVTFVQRSAIFENEGVGTEISFLPIGPGTYEYQVFLLFPLFCVPISPSLSLSSEELLGRYRYVLQAICPTGYGARATGCRARATGYWAHTTD